MKEIDKEDIDLSQHPSIQEKIKELEDVKKTLFKTPGLFFLKKSKFYYNYQGNLREHIATYKDWAILLKQEKIDIEELEDKNIKLYPALIKVKELHFLKKVNGNNIRKIKPKTLGRVQKIALVQGVVDKINSGEIYII